MSDELTVFLREELRNIRAEIASVSNKLTEYAQDTQASIATLVEKTRTSEKNVTELWLHTNKLTKRTDELGRKIESIENQAKGAHKVWAAIVAVLAAIGSAVGILANKGN